MTDSHDPTASPKAVPPAAIRETQWAQAWGANPSPEYYTEIREEMRTHYGVNDGPALADYVRACWQDERFRAAQLFFPGLREPDANDFERWLAWLAKIGPIEERFSIARCRTLRRLLKTARARQPTASQHSAPRRSVV